MKVKHPYCDQLVEISDSLLDKEGYCPACGLPFKTEAFVWFCRKCDAEIACPITKRNTMKIGCPQCGHRNTVPKSRVSVEYDKWHEREKRKGKEEAARRGQERERYEREVTEDERETVRRAGVKAQEAKPFNAIAACKKHDIVMSMPEEFQKVLKFGCAIIVVIIFGIWLISGPMDSTEERRRIRAADDAGMTLDQYEKWEDEAIDSMIKIESEIERRRKAR